MLDKIVLFEFQQNISWRVSNLTVKFRPKIAAEAILKYRLKIRRRPEWQRRVRYQLISVWASLHDMAWTMEIVFDEKSCSVVCMLCHRIFQNPVWMFKKVHNFKPQHQCMKHELNNLRASERVHTFCATFNTLFIPASNSFESAVRTKLTVESASKRTRQFGLYYNTAVTRLFYNSVTVAWCTCFAWLTMSIITSLGGLESQNRHVLETNGLKMACSKANG